MGLQRGAGAACKQKGWHHRASLRGRALSLELRVRKGSAAGRTKCNGPGAEPKAARKHTDCGAPDSYTPDTTAHTDVYGAASTQAKAGAAGLHATRLPAEPAGRGCAARAL